MSNCTNCGEFILFGGIKDGLNHFCSEKCRQRFSLAAIEQLAQEHLPDNFVEQQVNEFHQSDCPCCGGRGPIDIHNSYRCVSLIVLTRSQTIPQLSCRSCAGSAKLKNLLLTGFFGWWGLPWGLVLTPLYIGKNLYGLIFPTPSDRPSEQLRQHVKTTLLIQILDKENTDT
ncbi:MAG: hypothetical protein LBF88_08490 [Planctomycetaceae bacterium]|jgi:hypothetical protein|nr:hypothetical protein [Planctomycetaceae bacterium]